MPDSCIDTIITDPPYHLTNALRRPVRGPAGEPSSAHTDRHPGFLGHRWDGGGVAFDPDLWREVLRVAKPGAMLLACGSPRTFHRLAYAIEDAGWIVRDCLSWLYGSGFPKSLDIAKAIGDRGAADRWQGWGTALKPAWEPILLAMKPLDGSFAKNALTHGVAGLRVGACRVGAAMVRVNHYGNVRGVGPFTAPGDGSSTHAGEPYSSLVHTGRWPADLLLGHTPACVRLGRERVPGTACYPSSRPPGSYRGFKGQTGLRKQRPADELVERWRCAPDCPVRMLDDATPSIHGASRFFYCAKASRSDRDAGLGNGEHNPHPTVKPLELMRWLCRLTMTPTKGTVLDPFMGSGTTLLACRETGRPCIGIEREREYVKTACRRLRGFSPSKPRRGRT
jgi:site-specific DNA-methyltransferase (adenine-specific)